MAESLRDLEPPPAAETAAAAHAPDRAPGRARAGFRRRGVLIALGVVAAALFALQLQRNLALEARVHALGSELAAARAELGAYRERLSDVRTRVVDLRVRIGELEGLLEPPPAAPQEPLVE